MVARKCAGGVYARRVTLPPQPEKKPSGPKYKAIQRDRGEFTDLYIDHLIGADHPARLIWKIVADLDLIESEVMQTYFRRMEDPVTQALYKKRSQFAEFPNMKIKAVWGLDRFRLRGVDKVTKEAFWMVLAFTMDRWLLLRRQAASVVAA